MSGSRRPIFRIYCNAYGLTSAASHCDSRPTGSINTVFIEHLNLTLRHGLAALTRRSWATAQLTPELEAQLVAGLVPLLPAPSRPAAQTGNPPAPPGSPDATPLSTAHPGDTGTCAIPQRDQRGASVAAGLVKQIWSVEDALLFPVG
jgi:hypothetical protein